MREIKFRAINANGQMIYGLPYTDRVNDTIYYEDFNNRLCWRGESGGHCNQPYKNGTLMQYTGLKDKNGVEIYEGDMITLDSIDIGGELVTGEVVWCDDNTLSRLEWGMWLRGERQGFHPTDFLGTLEVIGNIYEVK